jgi:hypothetical protein
MRIAPHWREERLSPRPSAELESLFDGDLPNKLKIVFASDLGRLLRLS